METAILASSCVFPAPPVWVPSLRAWGLDGGYSDFQLLKARPSLPQLLPGNGDSCCSFALGTRANMALSSMFGSWALVPRSWPIVGTLLPMRRQCAAGRAARPLLLQLPQDGGRDLRDALLQCAAAWRAAQRLETLSQRVVYNA